MINIFEQGVFDRYSNVYLDEARGNVLKHAQYGMKPATTVFVSHSHEDLSDLKGLLGFLEREYRVRVYIDSQDPTMPKVTTPDTALNIKKRIKQCDKFILLATNKAIESKWCNWELGYGDADKYKKHIALFPLNAKGAFASTYKGSEYMDIYPHIAFYDGSEKYKGGSPISRGYYVCSHEKDRIYITPLSEWFNEK